MKIVIIINIIRNCYSLLIICKVQKKYNYLKFLVQLFLIIFIFLKFFLYFYLIYKKTKLKSLYNLLAISSHHKQFFVIIYI